MGILSTAEVTFVNRFGRAESARGIGESYQAMAADAWAGLHPNLPMPNEIDYEVHMQDIRGPLSLPDLGQREVCVHCGMVANVDPFTHAERYDHLPIIRRNGERWQFTFYSATFTHLLLDE